LWAHAAGDFQNDQAAISAASTTKANSQSLKNQEDANEDADDIDNDNKKAAADSMRGLKTVAAAIAAIDHSIAEVVRRIHHIRVYYFELKLARDAVRLELTKMRTRLRLLRSDWILNNCNCGNTTCNVTFKFSASSSTPTPTSFREGASCERSCRLGNNTAVNILNCSFNEAWQDDISEDILELHRLNRTLTTLANGIDSVVDLTNATGIMKTLVDMYSDWLAKRALLAANNVRRLVDIIADLGNSTIMDDIADYIHHCNYDAQLNTTCSFSTATNTHSCTHLVMASGTPSDTTKPDNCHLLALIARLGDSDITKEMHKPPSNSSGNGMPGDQDPHPANPCNSDQKRSIFRLKRVISQSSGQQQSVQTTYQMTNGTSTTGSTTGSTSSQTTSQTTSQSTSQSTSQTTVTSRTSNAMEFMASFVAVLIALVAIVL